MKRSKNLVKSITGIISAFIFILLASAGLFCLLPSKELKVEAVTAPESVTINNPKFESNTSSSYPFQPNGYTASSDFEDSDGKDVNGVINLKDGDFKDKYPNKSNTEERQYVLMIKGERASSYFGYTTNSALNLSANSHYVISVDVFTDNDNGIAYLYLFDEDGREFASIQRIRAYNQWSTCYFLVSTNQLSSKNVKIGLFLRGEGVVLYDNLSAYKISGSSLEDRKNLFERENSYYTYKDQRDVAIAEYVLSSENPILNKYMSGNDSASFTSHGYFTNAQDSHVTDGTHNSAFVVKNTQATYTQFITANNFLTFEQNNIYKVSITAKTVNLTGNASFRLLETNLPTNEDATNSDSITISTSSSTNNLTNDYQTYSFYVLSSSQKDTTYRLLISLGNEETLTTGSLYISNIVVAKVDYSTYSNATGSNNSTLNIPTAKNELYDVNDSDNTNGKYLDNGKFNSIQIGDATNPLPATPASWTVSVGKNPQKYGVINTSAKAFSEMKANNNINDIANPKPGSNENVLMMYNATKDTLTYTSASKNLDAQTYHRFSIDVYSFSGVKISLVYNNDGSKITLTSLDVATNGWETVNLFIYTGYQSLDVSLEVSLISNSSAVCFLDNARFNYSLQPTKEQFDAVTNGTNPYTHKVDLSNMLTTENENANYSNPNMFVGSGSADNYGIVSLNSSTLDKVLDNKDGKLDILRSMPGENKNMLGIYSQADTYYTFTSKLGYALSSGDGNYYKISISVYTPSIGSDKEDAEEKDLGASISLSSFADSFTNIKAYNSWETYTFYIHPDSNVSAAYLTVALGSSTNSCNGRVFFGNIQFEKLDVENDEEFNAIAKGPNTLVLNTTTTDNENSGDEENNSNNPSNRNWIYYVPSILFVVAIVIAVVGVLLRKVKWKKPAKKTKNTYDRNKTVSKQYYARKATSMREEKVRELEKELEGLHSQRATYEEEYKRDLTTLRNLKIKRASSAEISKLEKDMKKNRKLTSAIGLNIKKTENEIEYAKSDAYLNSITKKLSQQSSEKTTNTTETEEPKTEKVEEVKE